MSKESVLHTINLLETQNIGFLQNVKNNKKTINNLCSLINEPPRYPDADDEVIEGGAMVTRSDEFYGKPLATVVRTILERRQRANLGAASVPVIFDAMKEGGFHFEAKSDENARRGLYIALGKNTNVFHKLPQGTYGLREWYTGNIKESRSKKDKPVDDERPLHEELQAEAAEQSDEGEHRTVEVPVPKLKLLPKRVAK